MIGTESIVVDNVTISLEKYLIVSLKIDENQNQRQFFSLPSPLVGHFINNYLCMYLK